MVRFRQLRRAVLGAIFDLQNNQVMALSAGLAYYFLLSLFPLLIMLAAALAYVPIPNLFDQILLLLERVVPAEAMTLVRDIVASVVLNRRPDLLSLGIIGTLWVASTAFAAMIEALNVAYDVHEGRPFWKTRPIAIGLVFAIGVLVTCTLAAMSLGPQWGGWAAARLGLDPAFAAAWPYFRWIIALSFTVLAVEILYFVAPNVKQRFICTLPGAVIAVAGWLGLSYGLGLYIQNFGDYNRTYGTLGAVIILMLWFYLVALVLLVGAEINSELLKATGTRLPEKEQPDPESLEDPRQEEDLEDLKVA